MQCSEEEKAARQKLQKEAQKRLQEAQVAQHAIRLKELEAGKTQALVDKASKKR